MHTEDGTTTYLNEIGQISLLTAADERRLGQSIEERNNILATKPAKRHSRGEQRLIHEGNEAEATFTTSNLRLVVSIARRYPMPPGMELRDLVQEGNLGLMHAVEKFDWRKGFKFSTYATFWIRQAIGEALQKKAVKCT